MPSSGFGQIEVRLESKSYIRAATAPFKDCNLGFHGRKNLFQVLCTQWQLGKAGLREKVSQQKVPGFRNSLLWTRPMRTISKPLTAPPTESAITASYVYRLGREMPMGSLLINYVATHICVHLLRSPAKNKLSENISPSRMTRRPANNPLFSFPRPEAGSSLSRQSVISSSLPQCFPSDSLHSFPHFTLRSVRAAHDIDLRFCGLISNFGHLFRHRRRLAMRPTVAVQPFSPITPEFKSLPKIRQKLLHGEKKFARQLFQGKNTYKFRNGFSEGLCERQGRL